MGSTSELVAPKVIRSHYETVWQRTAHACHNWTGGPTWQMPPDFCVLEFAPTAQRNMWTYATCGMSCQGDADPLELHVFSPEQYSGHIELLTAIAHYHLTGAYLGLGHTVNFGRPWMPGSNCEFGLISLPYLDGPSLEWRKFPNRVVRFLWLIPITAAEREFKQQRSVEALENAFEQSQFDFLDPARASVI